MSNRSETPSNRGLAIAAVILLHLAMAAVLYMHAGDRQASRAKHAETTHVEAAKAPALP